MFVANGLAAGQRAQHFIIHVIPRKDGDNLLQVEEKLVDKEMRKKVKMLVENEFNKLMGIKKKVVKVEVSEESEEVVKKQPKIKKKREEIAPVEEQAAEKTPATEEEVDDEEIKDSEDTEEKESPKKDDGEASLDDIANLFK